MIFVCLASTSLTESDGIPWVSASELILDSLWMFHMNISYFPGEWPTRNLDFTTGTQREDLASQMLTNYSGVLGIKHGDSSNNRRYNQPTKVLEIQPTTLYCNLLRFKYVVSGQHPHFAKSNLLQLCHWALFLGLIFQPGTP